MELVISSEDLQDLILTRLDLMEDLDSSQGAGNANPKTGGQAPLRTNYEVRKLILVPCFIPVYCFHAHFSFSHPNWGPVAPVWGTSRIILI
jgi:hypothetical protein